MERVDEHQIEDVCDFCCRVKLVADLTFKMDDYKICPSCIKAQCPICGNSEERLENYCNLIRGLRKENKILREAKRNLRLYIREHQR